MLSACGLQPEDATAESRRADYNNGRVIGFESWLALLFCHFDRVPNVNLVELVSQARLVTS